jgi:hypothetical protein
MRIVAVLGLTLLVAACSLLPGQLRPAGAAAEVATFPAGCNNFQLTDRQCAFIVDRLGERLGVDRSTVREIQLLGDPGCGQEPGVICTRTTQFIVRVRFVGDDGSAVEDSQFCGIGGGYDLGCNDPPAIRLSAPMLEGYQDVPCAGEPPDGCASPVPTIDPAVADDGRPLRIPSIDVPLDHDGVYDIALGNAVLPNGVLSETTFALVDERQTTFALEDGAVSLVVSGPDGEPIWNVYQRGWRAGTETVDVRLVFEIAQAEPGAVLQVRDVVVR